MAPRRAFLRGLALALAVSFLASAAHSQDGGEGAGLDAVVPEFSVNRLPITDMVPMLAAFAEIDVITTSAVGNIPITANLTNKSVRQILDTVLPQYNLAYMVDAKSGIVEIMTQQEKTDRTRVVEELKKQTFDIKYADFRSVMQVVQQKRTPQGQQFHIPTQNKIIVIDTPAVLADIERTIRELDVPTVTVQVQLNYIDANEAANQVKPILSNLPGSLQVDSVQQRLVIRDLPDRVREAQEVLALLDQARELRVFEVQYADPEEIISMVNTMDILSEAAKIEAHMGTNKILIQDIPARVERAAEVIRALDEPPLQIRIEAEIVEMRMDDSLSFGTEFSWGDDVGTADIGDATEGLDLLVRFANGNLDVTDFDELFGSRFKYAINAAKTLNLAETIASPFGRVRNHEAFDFQDGSDEPYEVRQRVTTTTGAVGDDIYTQRSRSVGRILTVKPHANSSGMINLEISVEDSSARDKQGSGGQVLIAVDKKNVETMVDVMDGHTVALGGIIEESGTEGRTGIPILMDLPLLGRLFRTETKSGVRRKLLIFITPTIERMGGPGEETAVADLGLGEEADSGGYFDFSEENVAPPMTGSFPESGAEPAEGVYMIQDENDPRLQELRIEESAR